MQHRAGTPCTDASTMGKRVLFKGSTAKYFYIWTAQRRQLQEPIVLHENVPQFGVCELEELLGDIYYVQRCVANPFEFGWASERPRQICVLVLRRWALQILRVHY